MKRDPTEWVRLSLAVALVVLAGCASAPHVQIPPNCYLVTVDEHKPIVVRGYWAQVVQNTDPCVTVSRSWEDRDVFCGKTVTVVKEVCQ